MSTDLLTYLNYMSSWEQQSDSDVQELIDEQRLFKQVGDFESDNAIDEEFETLVSLATTVRDETISADAIQMAADAAAIASFWSFGLSMAAYAYLEASVLIRRAVVSKKSTELNKKLETADIDIASKINNNLHLYVEKYKSNNNLISSQCPKGLTISKARADLMQFMAQVDLWYKGTKGGLTVQNFKQLAASAKVAYNSPQIQKVYDALDELNLSDKSQDDINKFMNTLKEFDLPHREIVQVVLGLSISIAVYKMTIAKSTIEESARAAELPIEEVESSVFGMMDGVGKFAAGVAFVMSVVDVVMDIIDIVDIVNQTRKMVDELNNTIKPNYKKYFDGIKESSKSYMKAISDE